MFGFVFVVALFVLMMCLVFVGFYNCFYRAAWLHVMQTRYCDENSVSLSVRPSVCLSHAWIVTKR